MSGIKKTSVAGCLVLAGVCLLPVHKEAQSTANATEGLRSLMTVGLSAARQGDQAKLKEIARSLIIPDHELWFRAMFGEEEGTKLAATYGSNLKEIEKQYPTLFERLAKQEGELVIEDVKMLPNRNESWCGQTLVNMQKGDGVFYRVGVGKADSTGLRSGMVGGYFTLVSGGYRRLDCQSLGIMPASSAPSPHPLLGPLRVGGNVQAARIIKRVAPAYPEDAMRARISGTVRLHVIIGKDGKIKRLELVSGHPMLQQAAADAVRQWQYQPTLLNGDPVEVDTTIDVIFQVN